MGARVLNDHLWHLCPPFLSIDTLSTFDTTRKICYHADKENIYENKKQKTTQCRTITNPISN
jgi:hypothetical protein